MATKITLDTSEWDAFLKDFQSLLGPELPAVIHAAADEAGVALDEIVRSKLPPRQVKIPQAKSWSPRQRRWWWSTMHDIAQGKKSMPGWRAVYRVHDGVKVLEISGQYKRTGTLVKSLAYDIVDEDNGSVVHYGTNRDYAPYVIDEERQAWFMKAGGWESLQAIANERREDIVNAGIERAIKEARKILDVDS